jgi:methyl-accepting chemotaxis protein
VINGKPAAWNTLIDEKSGKPVLAMAVRITAGHNETEGVLAGLMNLDDLSNQIARWKSGNNGFAFLVDEAGNRILYAGATDPMGQKQDPSDPPLIKAFHKGKIGAIHFSDSHGVPSVGQVIRTASGWVVATQIPEKESPADLNPAKNAYARLLGAALALGLLMALLAAWLFTRPISELVRTADRISMGELTLEATTNRKDELGDLAEAITRMKESIRISMERLRRRRKSS